jgi:starch synthase
MRILLGSSEVHPYSKTGGLADATGALGKALARAGFQVGIVTPLYRGIRERFPGMRRLDWVFDFPVGGKFPGGEVWMLEPLPGLIVYFVHQPEYFDRAGLYNEHGADYWDNGERFIYFSKCVVHLARYLPWRPDVVHVSDWQTGLVPLLVRHQTRAERWANPPRTCFTIHNLAYQGFFPASTYEMANLPWDYFHGGGPEQFGQLNCLKAGIAFADVVTTVSPRYAREITTPEFGEGLDGLLRERQGQGTLVGILNGVDYEEWNTENNPYIHAPYSALDLSGKARCKTALQREFGLAVKPSLPLFGSITRLTEQKGLDILLAALVEMLNGPMQFVLLGSGAASYEVAFARLAERFRAQVGLRLGYDNALAHRIESGCDFYLMPSRFEPCGLNQMYSLRYGTIPIVRRTGGLDDSVVDASDDARKANGIKFGAYSADALARAMRKAMVLHSEPEWEAWYRRNAMVVDFSWQRALKQYLDCYKGQSTAPGLQYT